MTMILKPKKLLTEDNYRPMTFMNINEKSSTKQQQAKLRNIKKKKTKDYIS